MEVLLFQSCTLLLFLHKCEKLNAERYNEFEAFLKHPNGIFVQKAAVVNVCVFLKVVIVFEVN
jgi:hypothetical protein